MFWLIIIPGISEIIGKLEQITKSILLSNYEHTAGINVPRLKWG